MSLFSSSQSTLSRIRAKLFHFLWAGNLAFEKFNLAAWENLSLPRDCGGWGIKNLDFFNSSLCAKSLWRCLFSHGIWGKLIKENYFKGLDPIFWLRKDLGSKSLVSTIGSSLKKILPIITNYLSWQDGRGFQIHLGSNPICCMGGNFILS